MTYRGTLRFALCSFAFALLACGGNSNTFDDSDSAVPGDSASGDTSVSDGTGSETTNTDSGTSSDSTPIDAASCPGTVCGSLCTDLKTDPKNCGACDKVVCHNEACLDGKPFCAGGLKPCGGATGCLGCKNLNSDPLNCGACGKACAPTETCMPGSGGARCVGPTGTGGCSGGLTKCTSSSGAAACVDLSRDLTNCGACGKNCSPGEYCVGGACTPYTSAPGCSSCPCTFCKAPMDKCCRYVDATVCSTKCLTG